VQGLEKKKIWDPVTRLWHWILATVVVSGWSLGEFMAFDTVRWHFYLGYCLLGLLAFRILWGFVGPAAVRWRNLWPRASALRVYLSGLGQRKPSGSAGHNPLGSISVLVMLLLLAAQAATGLFLESDDFFESAPLAAYVSEATVNQLTWWHHLLAKLLLAMVILHLLAIVFYRIWKREDLVRPMITGWKWVRSESSTEEDR
jgi:cytochrome b